MKTKQQVLDLLTRAYGNSKYILMGEQCGGGREKPAVMLERYANASGGKMPAVMGVDLACYGLQLPQMGVGSDEWHETIGQIVDFAEKGGIVTASSHFANPTGDAPAWGACRGKFGGPEAWEEMLTEGTRYNKIIKEELLIDAKFLAELGDRGVTVLWRPLHEANGNWFWFCAKSHNDMEWIPPQFLRRFWIYIYNLYVNELGLKNLIWVYSPNVSQGLPHGTRDVLYYYPGDEYVDMVGLDWYTGNKKEINYPGHAYDKMMGVGKIAAITEFGPAGPLRVPDQKVHTEDQEKLFNMVDLVSLMKDLKKQGLKISYVLTWAGGCAAYALGGAEKALDDPFCITLEKVMELYED